MTAARAAALALCLLPTVTFAHSPIKGLDSFYAGLLHPVLVPAHVMSILAFGALIGQQGARSLQGPVIGFLLATSLGLALVGHGADFPAGIPLLVMAALSGGLVAWRRRQPLIVYHLLAAALGLMLGLDSAQDGFAGRALLGALLGTGIAIYLLALYAMAFADFCERRDWTRIGLRVLGSWIAASALLVLALQLAR